MAADTQVVVGFVQIINPGEALTDLDFPLVFVEKPVLTYSYDLEDGQVLERGNFPMLTVGVHYFRKDQITPGLDHYTGARLIIVATGHLDMRMNVHVRFEGKGLVGPNSPAAGI